MNFHFLGYWDGYHEHSVKVEKCEHCYAWISKSDMKLHKEWHYDG